MLKEPFVIVNFKTYKESTGKNAEKLAKKFSKVKGNFAFCPQTADLRLLSKYKVPLIAQHIDPIDFGRNTGWVLAESVKEAGAIGSLINHSEHQLSFEEIKKCIEACRRAGILSIVCAVDKKMVSLCTKLKPDYIAIEPPELIETGIAVSQVKPKVISDSVEAVKKIDKNIKVICGAGISKGEDVKKAIELGAVGVLVSSAIVKSKQPEKVLKEMIEYAK
ncbi:MAG: triose-phosphate isomerase [Candidatus Aenigmarchaeota archaeon]|nr:triose-phosphate isomerase [Candidatus Aenigmarchaeota archaeon]MBU5688763.1 triose-phosphate isomerase [Candidatus Aenigmarchaeota archaeon]